MKKVLLISLFLFTSLFAQLTLNEVPSIVILDKGNGEKISGGKFSSSEIKDKVYLFFYIDPDVKDINEEFTKTIKDKDYDRSKYNSIVVINMDATWIPNMAINSGLQTKQENYPYTIYVKDNEKVFVNKWDLKDDAYNVLLFDKDGKLLFNKAGKLNKEDTDNIIDMIEKRIKL